MLIYETIAYLTNQKTPTMIIQNSGSASKKTCLVFCVCKELHGFSGENVLKYASWKKCVSNKKWNFLVYGRPVGLPLVRVFNHNLFQLTSAFIFYLQTYIRSGNWNLLLD